MDQVGNIVAQYTAFGNIDDLMANVLLAADGTQPGHQEALKRVQAFQDKNGDPLVYFELFEKAILGRSEELQQLQILGLFAVNSLLRLSTQVAPQHLEDFLCRYHTSMPPMLVSKLFELVGTQKAEIFSRLLARPDFSEVAKLKLLE